MGLKPPWQTELYLRIPHEKFSGSAHAFILSNSKFIKNRLICKNKILKTIVEVMISSFH